MRKLFTSVFLICAVTACTQFSLLEPKRTQIGDAYSVDPQIAWSKRSVGHNEIWTVDGPALQEVRFILGVGKGDTLFASQGLAAPENWPKLTKFQRPSEVVDFFVDSLVATKANDVQTKGLRPTKFGTNDGFRFEFSFNRNGLNFDGVGVSTTIDSEVHMVLYIATQLHYFERYRQEFEAIIKSISAV